MAGSVSAMRRDSAHGWSSGTHTVLAMSFETFLHRFNAAGRAFGDGYGSSDFEGMSGEERARARSMLLERGLSGNRIDIHGLHHVGDAVTVAALDVAGTSSQDPAFDITRLETLFALTGERRHLDAMMMWVDAPAKKARGFAAEALSRQELPSDIAPAILTRLEGGRHEDLLRPLTNAWLATQGEPAGSDVAVFARHLPLIRAVCAAPPRRRRILLVEARLRG
jgi:hypothetical protein